eukprot:s8990_g2.t1
MTRRTTSRPSAQSWIWRPAGYNGHEKPRGIKTSGNGGEAGLHLTRVDPNRFDAKVERLGVSGGSAAFFRLCLKEPTAARPVDYFIGSTLGICSFTGKDLSHAEDEVNFYEEALSLRHGSGLEPLLGYTLEYAGVLSCTEDLRLTQSWANKKPTSEITKCRCATTVAAT